MPPRTAPVGTAAPSAALAFAKAKMQEKRDAQRKRFHDALGGGGAFGAFDSADDFDVFDFSDLFPIETETQSLGTTLDTPNSPKRTCTDDNDSNASSSSASVQSDSASDDVWPYSDSDLDDMLADIPFDVDTMTTLCKDLMSATIHDFPIDNTNVTSDELPPIPPSEGTATPPPTDPPTRYDTPEIAQPTAEHTQPIEIAPTESTQPEPPLSLGTKSKFLESLGPNVKLNVNNTTRTATTKPKRRMPRRVQRVVPYKTMGFKLGDLRLVGLRIAIVLDSHRSHRPTARDMLHNWCEGPDAPPIGNMNMVKVVDFIRADYFNDYLAQKVIDNFPEDFLSFVDECRAFLMGNAGYTAQVPQVAMV